MNIVLMTSRSGSSLVCKILAAHGLRWQDGNKNPEQNPRGGAAGYPTYEHPGWKATMKKTAPGGKWPLGDLVPVNDERMGILNAYWLRQCHGKVLPDFIKCGVEFAGLWMAQEENIHSRISFICVRRPIEQIAASLARRGIGDAAYGAEIAERRFKLMDMVKETWPFVVDVDTHVLAKTGMWRKSGIREAIRLAGGEPSNLIIKDQIKPDIYHE